MVQDPSLFISLQHLSKHVSSGDSQIDILKDINLTIKKGESIAIQGASGSGKTTLLSLMAGLDIPTAGEIYFLGKPLSQASEEQRAILRGQYVGFIFQSFQLLPTFTALENVMLPLEIHYIPHHEARERASEWLEKVGLGKRLDHYPDQLSGGEQQRVAIARAFVNRPEIIFADEMTGNLDTHTGDRILDTVFSLQAQQQITLVLVTHDINLTKRCDRCVTLSDGILTSC